MNLTALFKSRAHGTALQPAGDWSVESCSWAVGAGGCEVARLRARVKRASVAELAELLRCGLELYNSGGSVAWWGWIKSVTVQEGKAGGVVSLDWFANKIRVKYKILADTVQGEEEEFTTAWADDTVSQGIYGVKEKELELGITTQAQAENFRAAQLLLMAQPRLKPALFAGVGEDLELTIEAAGWFETLGWRYYALNSGLIEYIIEGAGMQSIGEATVTKVAQCFTVGTVCLGGG